MVRHHARRVDLDAGLRSGPREEIEEDVIGDVGGPQAEDALVGPTGDHVGRSWKDSARESHVSGLACSVPRIGLGIDASRAGCGMTQGPGWVALGAC